MTRLVSKKWLNKSISDITILILGRWLRFEFWNYVSKIYGIDWHSGWCWFVDWNSAVYFQCDWFYHNCFFSSIVNRGKLLHSAMNSLHNFDRSIDKFLAWLSETESTMEGVEGDVDRLGSRRDPSLLRQHLPQLKVRFMHVSTRNRRVRNTLEIC